MEKLTRVEFLNEFNWDLQIDFDNEITDVYYGDTEYAKHLQLLNQLCQRCKIDTQEHKTITLDFCMPADKQSAKIINEFVTSALVKQITIVSKDVKNNVILTYTCQIEQKLPDWHITFGIKNNLLILTCTYNVKTILLS